MILRLLIILIVLNGCATVSIETSPAQQKSSDNILIPMPAKDVELALDQKNIILADPLEVRHFTNVNLRPFERIDTANDAAKVEPGLENYSNAVQVYPYSEGALYQLYAAPEKVSLISLQRGEELISLSAGDTARWMVGDTVSGEGATTKVNIVVKPLASGLKTNLVITTSKRTYLLELRSFQSTYMAALSWSYPMEEAKAEALKRLSVVRSKEDQFLEILADDLSYEHVISGPQTKWRPIRVAIHKAKTYIQFPDTIGSTELPPFFETGADKKPQLLNYRRRGAFYIVDKLFDHGELRLGEKDQIVIRIDRAADSQGDQDDLQ